jgi:ABC-2 type transport system ATP-binding protein
VRLTRPAPAALDALAAIATAPPMIGEDLRTLSLAVDDERGAASRVVAQLHAVGIEVDEIAVHRPSLDDVFFHLTGHAAELDSGGGEAA